MKFAILALLSTAAFASARSAATKDDPVIRALMAKIDALSAKVAKIDALSAKVAKVDALSAEVASLKLKSEIPAATQGNMHVRRGLQLQDDAQYLQDVEPQSLDSVVNTLLHKVDHFGDKVEAIYNCVHYNSVDDICTIGGDAINTVEVKAYNTAYIGTGNRNDYDDSGIRIVDDQVNIFSETGRIDVDAGTNLEMTADGDGSGNGFASISTTGSDGLKLTDSQVNLSSDAGRVDVDAGTNLEMTADGSNGGFFASIGMANDNSALKIFDAQAKLYSNTGRVDVDAGTNLEMRAGITDVNGFAYLGTGDGSIGDESGLQIVDARVNLFSETGRIAVEAGTRIDVDAGTNLEMTADGSNGGFFASIGMANDNSALKIFDAQAKLYSNTGRVDVDAGTNLEMTADGSNGGFFASIGMANGNSALKVFDAQAKLYSNTGRVDVDAATMIERNCGSGTFDLCTLV